MLFNKKVSIAIDFALPNLNERGTFVVLILLKMLTRELPQRIPENNASS